MTMTEVAQPKEIIDQYGLLLRKIAGKIARGLAQRGISVIDEEDLYSVGCMEAVRAVERYDPTKGTKLSTWIAALARRAMTRESLRSQGLKRTAMDGAMAKGPVSERLSEQLREARARAFVSIDDEGLEAEVGFWDENRKRLSWLSTVVGSLPPGEREAFELMFEPEATMESVGARLGVSKQRVEQLKRAAIERVQRAARRDGIT